MVLAKQAQMALHRRRVILNHVADRITNDHAIGVRSKNTNVNVLWRSIRRGNLYGFCQYRPGAQRLNSGVVVVQRVGPVALIRD